MANPYGAHYQQFAGMGRVAGPSKREQAEQKNASAISDILRMIGGVAPAAGGAIGALAGGPAGAVIGSGIGQVAGGLAEGGANMVERPSLERQAARDRQIEAMLAAFGRGR